MGFVFKADDISRLGLAVTFGAAAVFIVAAKDVLDLIVHKMMGDAVVSTILILDGLSVDAEPHAPAVAVTADGPWPALERPDMIYSPSRTLAPFNRSLIRSEHGRVGKEDVRH